MSFTKTADSTLMTVTSVDTTGKETKMKHCSKCGALVPEDSMVCPVCKGDLGGNN